VEPAFAQILHDPLADDTQAQNSNVFPCPTRHFLVWLRRGAGFSAAR